MAPPGSAAAQVIEQLLKSKDPILRLPGQPLIQEIHDLAVRLEDLDAPGRELHLSVKPEDVVEHRKSLARAARLLGRSAHRVELLLEADDDRAGPALWALRFLQQIHSDHPDALGFSPPESWHPAILSHFEPGDRGDLPRPLWLAVLRRCRGQDPAEAVAEELGITGALDRPVLFLLDRPGQWLEVIPEGPIGRRFDFKTGRRAGDDPRLEGITGRKTLQIKPGEISVLDDGRELASFFLTAFLFSRQDCWDPDFWIPCALQALELAAGKPVRPAGTSGPTETRPEPARDTVALAEKLRGLLIPPPSGASYRVASIEPSLGRHVVITLCSAAQPEQELIVLAEPREGADKFFCEAGRLVLSYSDQTPLDTSFRRQTLEKLATRLAGE
jgi:hypothetical protein